MIPGERAVTIDLSVMNVTATKLLYNHPISIRISY